MKLDIKLENAYDNDEVISYIASKNLCSFDGIPIPFDHMIQRTVLGRVERMDVYFDSNNEIYCMPVSGLLKCSSEEYKIREEMLINKFCEDHRGVSEALILFGSKRIYAFYRHSSFQDGASVTLFGIIAEGFGKDDEDTIYQLVDTYLEERFGFTQSLKSGFIPEFYLHHKVKVFELKDN